MKTQCLTSVMEVARLIRTKSDAAKLDGEVFSAGVLSPPSPPCTGGLGGLFPAIWASVQ